ncbi:hypothetical protein BH24ACT22_BH24ACT22_06790 [soil metagenome]
MSSQLLFLIIFLVVAALVVLGTLAFITRVDRSLADEAKTRDEKDEHRTEEKS